MRERKRVHKKPVPSLQQSQGQASDIAFARLRVAGLPDDWRFPTTRYRGSKRRILQWIWEAVRDLKFATALDVFGGTCSVSLLFKWMEKEVTCNDILKFNYQTACAFVENKSTYLTDEDLTLLVGGHRRQTRPGFIARNFDGYYFAKAENEWLDETVRNILQLRELYSGRELREKQALAYWAVGQACLIKRPFNLFHRRNLNLRRRRVRRSFGNKKTWDMPFRDAFLRFADEANAVIFDNGRANVARWGDGFRLDGGTYDLVYLDPPYFFDGQKDAEFGELYHFLEGITQYDQWGTLVDYGSWNRRLVRTATVWKDKSRMALAELYGDLISKYSESIIVISHKSGSRVPIGLLKRLLLDTGKRVRLHRRRYRYALSKKNGLPHENIEWLIIGH